MKGYVITLDAFLALMLLTFVMAMVLSQDYGDSQYGALYMRAMSMRMLAAFEKSGVLAAGISRPSELRAALNGLPPNVCSQLTVYNSTNSTVMDVQKDGCAAPSSPSVSYRTFYANNSLYLAKSTAWSK